MDKELTVNLANLNQAETIRTRLEKQVDSLDVTNAYSERKINDLQMVLFPLQAKKSKSDKK